VVRTHDAQHPGGLYLQRKKIKSDTFWSAVYIEVLCPFVANIILEMIVLEPPFPL
jgi:hypothetical protein